jgi:putative transposase
VIRSLKKAWPVSLMCRLLKVPRSSYYAFAARPPKPAASPPLLKAVRQIHSESRSSYGSRRMAQALQQQGYAIGRYRARSLMREAQLAVARRRTHRYRKAEGEALIAPNLLERQFEPGAINRVWAGDITYVRTRQGWSYLAIVMDLHSRRIVGWAFALQADTELVIQALQQARQKRRPAAGLMFHSDQGCQGGFNRSLQHLLTEVSNGTTTGLEFGTDGKTNNAIAWQAWCQSARDKASILELYPAGHGDRGCCAGMWRVTTFGTEVVS